MRNDSNPLVFSLIQLAKDRIYSLNQGFYRFPATSFAFGDFSPTEDKIIME